jgi:hypothetical protein
VLLSVPCYCCWLLLSGALFLLLVVAVMVSVAFHFLLLHAYYRDFDLSFNALSGSVPASLCLLARATGVDLSGNALSGSLPSDIGRLRSLLYLDVSYNLLDGSLPTSIGSLTSITRNLILSHNEFSGSLPETLGLLSAAWWVLGFMCTRETASHTYGHMHTHAHCVHAR